MSMISGLIDELNKSADEWNGSNMFELARMCRDAADTIWQLRDDLQRANRENTELQETLQRRSEQFEGMGEMWVERGVENFKLRELVRDMFGAYRGAVEMMPSSYSKNVAERAVMDISDRMRELRIEVDDA